MKTSNKILLGVAVSIIAVVVLFPLLMLRISIGQNIIGEHVRSLTDVRQTKTFPINDFTGIQAEGVWDIQLIQGESYQVNIEAPEDYQDYLVVEKVDNILHLSLKERPNDTPLVLKATVALPTLSELQIDGLTRVHFTGFTSEHFTIRSGGHTTIIGTGNTIESLHVNGDGFLKLNLKENLVTHADLRYHGLVDIALSMAGGKLTGLIDGFGKVVYDGEVEEYTLERNVWE